MAKALGCDIASHDLYEIFDLYLRDLDEMKMPILEHLSGFLRLFNQECRDLFISAFPSYVKSLDDNWRLREILTRYRKFSWGNDY